MDFLPKEIEDIILTDVIKIEHYEKFKSTLEYIKNIEYSIDEDNVSHRGEIIYNVFSNKNRTCLLIEEDFLHKGFVTWTDAIHETFDGIKSSLTIEDTYEKDEFIYRTVYNGREEEMEEFEEEEEDEEEDEGEEE